MPDLKQRIYEIVKTPSLGVLATLTEDGKPWARYVTPWADQDLTLRLATFVGSRKVAQIKNNPNVHLTIGVTDPTAGKPYLQIAGTAAIKDDQQTKTRTWFDGLEHIFSGPSDPNYVVVEIAPVRIELQGMGMQPPEVWEG